MTYNIFKLKFSTISSAEHGLRGSKEMAFWMFEKYIWMFIDIPFFDSIWFCLYVGNISYINENSEVVRQWRISHREIWNIENFCDNQV